MKKLAIICGTISVILLGIGSAISNLHIASAGATCFAAAVLFWFLGNYGK